MSYLDDLLFGIRKIYDDGTELPQRSELNIVGATIADNPSTKQTDITITGAGATPDATTLVNGKVRLAAGLGGSGTTAAAPKLDADHIASGTLAVARGGTGLTSLGTALQYLRVNAGASALEYATLDRPELQVNFVFGTYTFNQSAIDLGTEVGAHFVDANTPNTQTLPTATGALAGHRFTVADWGRHAATSAITVNTPDGKLINGAASVQITEDGGALTFQLVQETLSLFHWVIVANYNVAPAATPDATTLVKGKIQLAGDLAGTATSVTVAKINGASVPAAGSLTTGNLLQVSGAAALVYAALNLAGGANYVTGVLPAGNQAAQTMAGDVTGTTAASVVAKINGGTVPAAGSLTTDHVLKVSGSSAYTQGYILNANVDAAAAIAGTKIDPAFGSQNVSTTGTLSAGSTSLTSINVDGGALTAGSGLATAAKLRVGSSSASSAGAGAFGIPNNNIILARNAANSDDVAVLSVNTSNEVVLGGTNAVRIASTLQILTTANLAVGTSPASTGSVRLSNGGSVHGAESGGTARRLVEMSTGNEMLFGDTGGGVARLQSGNIIIVNFGSGAYFGVQRASTELFKVDNDGNFCIFATAPTSAAKNIVIGNGTAPTADPASAGALWVESGALKYRGSGGTITTLASA